METSAPAWEQVKENTAPLERGRNVAALERSLSACTDTAQERQKKEQMIKHCERLVRPSEKQSTPDDPTDNNDDPLIHWLSYIKFYQDAFPSDTHEQFLLMERCTRALVGKHKFANDIRFIRVCVMYADKTSMPEDIFKYLHSQKVGTLVALFWIAWAWVAEKKGDYAFAEKVFKKAISKQAKPLQMLKQRHKQFQRRMSRHWLNTSQAMQDEDEIEEHAGSSTRGALGGLSKEATRRNDRRSENRTASQQQQQPPHEYRSNNNSTLSTFSVRTAATSAASGCSESARSDGKNSVAPKSGMGGFAIFVEDSSEKDDGGYNLDQSRGKGERRELEKEADRKKENTLTAARWNEHGGLTSATAPVVPAPSAFSVQSRPPSNGPPPPFAIHIDEECAANHKEESEEEEQKQNNKREREQREQEAQRDERTLRQKLDMGVVEKLTRDPLRYMRNPSKLAVDQANEGLTTTTTSATALSLTTGVKSYQESQTCNKKESGVSCGFLKHLVGKDASGQEQCFEEGRVKSLCYNLVNAESNFNMLVVTSKQEESNQDTSKEKSEDYNDVAMEIEDTQAEGDDNTKRHQVRKVLFGDTNTSTDSRNTSFARNTSTTSSTIDESTAVGVPVGKEEETINTKFAMKELSMMFASPVMGLEDISENGRPNVGLVGDVMGNDGSSESFRIFDDNDRQDGGDGDNATLSLVSNFMGDDNDNDAENFVPRNPVARTNATPGFEQSALRQIDIYPDKPDRDDHVIVETEPIPSGAGFGIYSDNTAGGTSANGRTEVEFQVYSEPSITASPLNESKRSKSPLVIFQDKEEIYKEACIPDDNGDTATFSQFGDALKALDDDDDHEQEDLSHELKDTFLVGNDMNDSPTDDFKKYGPQNTDAVLMNTVGFGDISMIHEDETANLAHPTAARSPTLTVSDLLGQNGTIDYGVLHKDDVKVAFCQVQDDPKCNRPGQRFPHALLKKDAAYNGAEIMGTGTVKHELGRGTYGVVMLIDLDANGDNSNTDAIAVKIQSPTDCLAWEYKVMQKVEQRIAAHWKKNARNASFPFPRALSFVSMVDGGLLGMTAGSKSGLNLVDISNIYKMKERSSVPELIAMHYTARMLKHLETLHWHGKVLHCDIKPDNWVLASSSDAYAGCKDVVEASDLMLVDFGRAVDLTTVAKEGMDPLEVKLFGNASAKDMACVAMKKDLGWSFDVDTYGICASAHVLLHGSHMDIQQQRTNQRWMPRKPLRRYWNNELWTEIFDTLLNLDGKNSAIGSRPHSLRSLRKSLEQYLTEERRIKELESLLKRQSRMLPEKRL